MQVSVPSDLLKIAPDLVDFIEEKTSGVESLFICHKEESLHVAVSRGGLTVSEVAPYRSLNQMYTLVESLVWRIDWKDKWDK